MSQQEFRGRDVHSIENTFIQGLLFVAESVSHEQIQDAFDASLAELHVKLIFIQLLSDVPGGKIKGRVPVENIQHTEGDIVPDDPPGEFPGKDLPEKKDCYADDPDQDGNIGQ
jgi:hypothetical protein